MGTKDSKDIIAPVVAWHDNTSSNTNSNSNLELLPELPPKDNFIDWQSDGEKMWMAVRISKMLENMDHHTAVLEARNLLKLKKNPRQLRPKPDFNFKRVYNFEIDTIQDMYLLSLRWQAYIHELQMRSRRDYGDAMEAWQLVNTLEDQKCKDIRECLAEHIHQTRQEAKVILRNMKDLATMRQREIYLLRQYIKTQFKGHKSRLVGRYLDHKEPNYSKLNFDSVKHYYITIFLPVYFSIIAMATLGLWQFIGYGAVTYWALGVFVAYLLELTVIQPLCVCATHVVIPDVLRFDLILHWRTIRTRARSLVTRNHQNKAGSIMDHQTNSMIQHFNPACRVARALPYLSVSRILIALNDYDMPFERLKKLHTTTIDKYSENEDMDKFLKYCKSIYDFSSTIFITILSYLPYKIQDLVLDFIIIILFYQMLILFGVMSGGISGLSVIYILMIVAAIVTVELYVSKMKIMTDEEKLYSVGRMCPRRQRKKKKKHRHHHLSIDENVKRPDASADMDALVNLMAVAKTELKKKPKKEADYSNSNNNSKSIVKRSTKVHVVPAGDLHLQDYDIASVEVDEHINDDEELDDVADIPVIEYKHKRDKDRRKRKAVNKEYNEKLKEEEKRDKRKMKELGLKYNSKIGEWETAEERENRRRIKKEKKERKKYKLLKKEEKQRIMQRKLEKGGLVLSSETEFDTEYTTGTNGYGSTMDHDSSLLDSIQ